MDGSTGGNHGSGTVVLRKPPEGHGPEIAYDDSAHSSMYDNNTQRQRSDAQFGEPTLPGVSSKFLQNFEDTDDSADDHEEVNTRRKGSLIKVDEQRRRQPERNAGKGVKKGPKHHRWNTELATQRQTDRSSRHAPHFSENTMTDLASVPEALLKEASQTYVGDNLHAPRQFVPEGHGNRASGYLKDKVTFAAPKRSQQLLNRKFKREPSHHKAHGRQILDSYVPGVLPPAKKKRGPQASFLFDQLDSKGNLPILTLQSLDKALPI